MFRGIENSGGFSGSQWHRGGIHVRTLCIFRHNGIELEVSRWEVGGVEVLVAEFDDGVACSFPTIFLLTSSVIACFGVSCPNGV